MLVIDIPEDKDAITHVWGEMVLGIGRAASRFSAAVYADTTLGLREFEAARLRIAQINGCLFCLDWRTDRDGRQVEEGFLAAVAQWRTTDAFDERTRLAAEYAERYAVDHHGLDEEFWSRMKAAYEDREIVELSMCIGSWLAFGRLNHVLGINAVCELSESLIPEQVAQGGQDGVVETEAVAEIGRAVAVRSGRSRRSPTAGTRRRPPGSARTPSRWSAPSVLCDLGLDPGPAAGGEGVGQQVVALDRRVVDAGDVQQQRRHPAGAVLAGGAVEELRAAGRELAEQPAELRRGPARRRRTRGRRCPSARPRSAGPGARRPAPSGCPTRRSCASAHPGPRRRGAARSPASTGGPGPRGARAR